MSTTKAIKQGAQRRCAQHLSSCTYSHSQGRLHAVARHNRRACKRVHILKASSAANTTPNEPSNGSPSNIQPVSSSVIVSSTASAGTAVTPPPSATEPKPVGVLQKIKNFFVGDKMDKEKLASLGMGAFASYGVVSNVTYGICVVIAWITFVKSTGQSPLWPGQWQGFLGVYAGLFVMQNFIRPLRFSLALIMAPLFDSAITWIAARTNLAKQWAFSILLLGIAVSTTFCLGSALWLLGGFPPAPAT